MTVDPKVADDTNLSKGEFFDPGHGGRGSGRKNRRFASTMGERVARGGVNITQPGDFRRYSKRRKRLTPMPRFAESVRLAFVGLAVDGICADPMLLWTIAEPDTCAALLRRGILRGDARRGWRDFKPAYRWMIEQMRVRGLYDGCPVRTPFWAWVEKPDLRGVGHLPRGTHGVRVCFDAPDDLALLSDFIDWHLVLNWSVNAERGRDSRRAWVASWTDIFNVNECDVVQACLPYLRQEWVREAREFVAR